MIINIKINKNIGYSINIEQYVDLLKQDTEQNISFIKKLDRRFAIVATSSTGHYVLNQEKDSVSLSEILSTLINGHNDELVTKLSDKYEFIKNLLQKIYHYFY